MPDDIKKIIEETAEKTAKKINDHFDVVAEDLKGEIKQVAEGVTANAERLERLEPMEQTLEQVKVDVDVMKTTLEGHTRRLLTTHFNTSTTLETSKTSWERKNDPLESPYVVFETRADVWYPTNQLYWHRSLHDAQRLASASLTTQ